jgi:C4-type Zn-finger protein
MNNKKLARLQSASFGNLFA